MTDPRVRYSLEVLLGSGRVSDAPISYGNPDLPGDGEPAIHIVSSGFFGSDYGTAASLPNLPLANIEGVPLLFGAPEVVRRGPRLMVYGDLVASAYFLLTRYEEWVRRDVRDGHGRFTGRESLPYRAGFVDRPVVDEYADLLRKWAVDLGIDWPEPKRRFSVMLTHDVDFLGTRWNPIQSVRSLASGLLGRQPLRTALRRAASSLGLGGDPLDNLTDVIALDGRIQDRFGPDRCRCVYFFLAAGRAKTDGNYDIQSRKARRALENVLASGATVGLHAGYEAGADPARLAAERATLEEVAGVAIDKNRSHFLRCPEPGHGHRLADAGIAWDSTLTYPDVAGFRLGVCRPIPLFDPVRKCPVGIQEHPLIVMDVTLSQGHYMALDEEAAMECVCRLADQTARHQGELVVLWHNDGLASSSPSYHRRLYPRLLDYLCSLLASA